MKRLFLLLISIILICVFSGCNSSQTVDNNTSSVAEENTTEKIEIDNENSVADTENNNSVDEEKDEESKIETYTHTAISGAVIVDQDGSKNFKYKEKCEKCGKIDNTSTINASGTFTTLKTSFYCSECGNMQTVEIKSSSN